MNEQDRLRILYLLTLRDIDHARKRRVAFARYWAPIVLLIVALAALAVAYHLSATQTGAAFLAAFTASFLAHVGWSNMNVDRIEAMEYRAAELRLDLDGQPAGADLYKSAAPIEMAIREAQRHVGLPQGVDADLDSTPPISGRRRARIARTS